MTLVRLNNRFDSHVNRFYGHESLFNSMRNEWPTGSIAHNQPSANILESDKLFVIEMAIPGFTKKDISITLENNLLTVSHKNESDKKPDLQRFARKEFERGDFSRSFKLSRWVETDSIKANFKNGILEIEIPKKAEVITKPVREIEIR